MNIDLAFYNGIISTLNPSRPEGSALGVSSGNIVAAGSNDEVLAQATAGTQHIDLNGRRVLPGLNDSHLHMIHAGWLHWPTPTIEKPTDEAKGPVMVSVEYHIDPNREGDFRQLMHSLRASRLRDGAIGWQLYGDPTVPGRYLEQFMVGSWLNHLRQHDRVTASDAALQERVRTLLTNGAAPVVTHFMVKTTRP